MAKAKAGPRRHYALVCNECKNANYISETNFNNFSLKNNGQTARQGLKPNKHCSNCQTHTSHTIREKMK